ncbi:MFS transporter [Streptomyces sp. OZ13]|uniref:MFS transporter n=1 Tax=Streptomyces sp. OZ13 TaxID=3452210 RepID=UPI003F8A8ED8
MTSSSPATHGPGAGNGVFAMLWGGQLISLLGSSAASFALSLTIYSTTGSASALAMVTAATLVGGIYLAPLAGAVSDHFPRRTVVVFCDVALAITSLALAWVAHLGAAGALPLVVALVFVAGTLNSALSVTMAASVRQLRAETDLTRVNGVTSFLENIPTLVGPLVGAAVYALAEPAVVFAVDAGTFVISAVLACSVRWNGRPAGGKQPLRPFKGAAAGLRIIWKSPDLRFLQLSFAGVNFFNAMGAATATAYVVAASSSDAGHWNLALYSVAGSAGLLVGSSLVAVLGHRFDRRRLIGGSVVAGAVVGRIGLVLTALPALWAVAAVVRNAANQLTNAPLTAIWQERVRPEIQASVFGARRLLGQGPYPLAVFLGGFLGDQAFAGDAGASVTGLGVLLFVAACGEAAAGLVLLLTSPLRRLAEPAGTAAAMAGR